MLVATHHHHHHHHHHIHMHTFFLSPTHAVCLTIHYEPALHTDVLKVLSLTATSRIVVPQNSKLSKLGRQSAALISHIPGTSPKPNLTVPSVLHPTIPSLDVSMGVYLTSLGAALASVERWYSAAIRQSLAKWSLKQLFTLAVFDLGEASEQIAKTVARNVDVPGCSEVLQQCRDHLQVSGVGESPGHSHNQLCNEYTYLLLYKRTLCTVHVYMYVCVCG